METPGNPRKPLETLSGNPRKPSLPTPPCALQTAPFCFDVRVNSPTDRSTATADDDDDRSTLPKRCWEEAPEAYRARLKACAAHINGTCDVEGLCRELPSRVKDLADREGDRLAK